MNIRYISLNLIIFLVVFIITFSIFFFINNRSQTEQQFRAIFYIEEISQQKIKQITNIAFHPIFNHQNFLFF